MTMQITTATVTPAKGKNRTIAQLVGRIFSEAPLSERRHLLEYLLNPMGVLSLMTVASGVFAKLRFRSGLPDMTIQLEDVSSVQVSDVTALVNYIQQTYTQVVDNLGPLVASQPVMAGTAAAAVLIMLLKMHENTPVTNRSLPLEG